MEKWNKIYPLFFCRSHTCVDSSCSAIQQTYAREPLAFFRAVAFKQSEPPRAPSWVDMVLPVDTALFCFVCVQARGASLARNVNIYIATLVKTHAESSSSSSFWWRQCYFYAKNIIREKMRAAVHQPASWGLCLQKLMAARWDDDDVTSICFKIKMLLLLFY